MVRLRTPTRDDAEAVLDVLVARDIADFREPDFTLEDLLDQWRASEFDLATDAVVAEDRAGTIIGYAALWSPGALAVVDPAREREGVGTRLLAWAERRACELGRVRHRQWVAERNARGHALLARAGYRYRRARSYWRLVRALDAPPPVPRPPGGIALRALDQRADAEALHALNEAAFATNADYEPESFTAFHDEHLASHDLDPGLSRVARRASTVVGFVLCRRWETGVGFVDVLAVDPAERGRGLAPRCCSPRSPRSPRPGCTRRSSVWRPTTRARCGSTSASP